MKILVRSENRTIRILFPTGLLLNHLTAFIAVKALKSALSVDLTAGQIVELAHAIKAYKRRHKGWELVNITSSNGDIVYIRL